jgi:hypothetical protein
MLHPKLAQSPERECAWSLCLSPQRRTPHAGSPGLWTARAHVDMLRAARAPWAILLRNGRWILRRARTVLPPSPACLSSGFNSPGHISDSAVAGRRDSSFCHTAHTERGQRD